jgi:hypothetical protein
MDKETKQADGVMSLRQTVYPDFRSDHRIPDGTRTVEKSNWMTNHSRMTLQCGAM